MEIELKTLRSFTRIKQNGNRLKAWKITSTNLEKKL
jgi:hypothetical protein